MANVDTVNPDENGKTEETTDNIEKTKVSETVEAENDKEVEKETEEKSENEEKPKPDKSEPLSKELEGKIVRQIEYYFGDINLPRDKFLLEQVQLDDGWVPLTVLLTFKRLASLTTDADAIAQVMLKSDSKLIEVSEDRKKLRRNSELPVPENNEERRKELMTRTAYAKGFPANETLESLMKYFETYGPFEGLNMRHYFDKATKKNIFKGSVFVIFKDIETCKKFVELEEVKFNETVLIKKWQADYVEEKRQEREERSAKRGKGKKKDEEQKETRSFPKGAILFMEGFTKKDTVREKIKEKIVSVNGIEPAYITFNKGDTEGYVRFAEENGAVEFAKKLTDNKFEVDENELTVRVLEGDEEETYLTELSETMSKIRNQIRNSGKGRGRKRKGFGDSGPRSKQSKK